MLWATPDGFNGRVEQVWFRGTHGDVGGQLGGFEAARPLANIPFRWIMERLEDHGVALPEGWQARFPTDPKAPSVGTWRGWGKIFLLRGPRVVGRDRSERLHETVAGPRSRPAGPGSGALVDKNFRRKFLYPENFANFLRAATTGRPCRP